MGDHVAGVGAGRVPEFIEMKRVGLSHRSGSTRVSCGGVRHDSENHQEGP
jgi:hypothetical protein